MISFSTSSYKLLGAVSVIVTSPFAGSTFDIYAFSIWSHCLKCLLIESISRSLSTSTTHSLIWSIYTFFIGWFGFNVPIQSGISTLTLSTGNSYKASFNMLYTSFSFIVSALIGITGTLCSSFNFSANLSVSGSVGCAEFNKTINGLPISFSSLITSFSASI